VQLHYFVPFKAQEGVSEALALKEKLINIEGIAVDTSVNANKWQVSEKDLDVFTQSLLGVQLRMDHAESVLMVVGKVSAAKRNGTQVFFTAEVGDEKLIEKILRKYVDHVSVQVDSDDVECSMCKKQTRSEGMLIHLCPGAWEIVHKPKVRELSVVASPAYQNTAFKPVGFGAAMDQNQSEAELLNAKNVLTLKIWKAQKTAQLGQLADSIISQSFVHTSDDEGSKRKLQEPEKQKMKASKEVKHMSELNAQNNASSDKTHQAAIVNTGGGEKPGKDESYEDIMSQLEKLSEAVKSCGGSGNEMADLNKKVDDLTGEVAKRATKRSLSMKISALQKQLQQDGDDDDDDAEAEGAEAEGAEAEGAKGKKGKKSDACKREGSKAEGKAHGKGIVATDELKKDAAASALNCEWFKDLLKANNKMKGMQ
jgi:hypothetical protein